MRRGEIFLKQKMNLALEDLIVNLKRHIANNEKVTYSQFVKEYFIRFIDEVMFCGKTYNNKISSESV